MRLIDVFNKLIFINCISSRFRYMYRNLLLWHCNPDWRCFQIVIEHIIKSCRVKADLSHSNPNEDFFSFFDNASATENIVTKFLAVLLCFLLNRMISQKVLKMYLNMFFCFKCSSVILLSTYHHPSFITLLK